MFGMPIAALSFIVGFGSEDIFSKISIVVMSVDCGVVGLEIVLFSLCGSILCVTEDLRYRGIIGSSYAITILSAVSSISYTSALSPVSSMWCEAAENRSVRMFSFTFFSCGWYVDIIGVDHCVSCIFLFSVSRVAFQ